MPARTEQKARLLDLTTKVLELARDGNRDIEQVCKVFQIIKDKPNFPLFLLEKRLPLRIWPLKLGPGPLPDDNFREHLQTALEDFETDHWARKVLEKIDLFRLEAAITVGVFSVADLGFKEETRWINILKRAEEFDFFPCPAEVGPRLRLKYRDQPNGEQVLIAMKKEIDPNNNSGVFCLKNRDGVLGLRSHLFFQGEVPYILPETLIAFRISR